MRHALTPQQSLKISAFQTDIDDLIDFTVLSFDPFEGENQNVAEARVRGIEAAWEFTGDALERACRSDLPGSAQPARTTRCCCGARRRP